MSVTTPEAPVNPTTPIENVKPDTKPKTKAKPKRDATAKSFTKDASLSQVVAAVAAKRQIDTTKAGKLVRSHIRANYESYAKGTKGAPKWGALTKAKENRDGNRYPAMPASVANAIVTRMSSPASSK